MPAELSLIAARSSADRPRLVTALTSAPRSSSRLTLSASVTDIIKAVNPAPFAAFTDAPLSSSMRIESREPLTAVCISGVMPPRGSAAFGSAPALSRAARLVRSFARMAA